MKPFVFRWQRILKIARGYESESKNNLAQAIGDLTRAEDLQDRLHHQRLEQKQKRFEEMSKGIEADQLKQIYEGEILTDQNIMKVHKVIESCEKNVDARREDLAEKMRERKTYEILRGKAFEEYRTEMKREESRDVDEVASVSFGRTENNENI